jgi:acyl carrier protein
MTVLEKVINTLARQLERRPDEISADTNIIEDMGADSLDLVELVMELEKTYNIIINDNTADLSTVGKIAEFIEKKLANP